MQRREFIKTVMVASVMGGLGMRKSLGGLVGTVKTGLAGAVTVSLSDFSDLAAVGGSIRVAVPGFISAKDPMILTRTTANTFVCVSAICAHQGCIVEPFNGSRIVCFCHGSEYLADGTVMQGPATGSLRKFTASFDGNNSVLIRLPGIGYSVAAALVQTTGGKTRFRIDFPSVSGTYHQVAFHPTLNTSAETLVKFSLTADGPADSDHLLGDDTNKSVFVDVVQATGFYTIVRSIP
jgi:nitrite reductase/ring-hydroxylating ferredoxin subunit